MKPYTNIYRKNGQNNGLIKKREKNRQFSQQILKERPVES